MLRSGLTLLLAVWLLGTEAAPTFAMGPQTPDPSTVETQVKKFGVGKSVKVSLVGGELVRGHIRAIDADSFTVKTCKSSERSIPYAQVTEIKDPPGPITYILIGAAIVVVVILIVHH